MVVVTVSVPVSPATSIRSAPSVEREKLRTAPVSNSSTTWE